MKISRNDSCPCGSGLKYKKCCLLEEQDKKQIKIIGQREYYREAFSAAQKEYREGKGPLREYFDDLEIVPDPEWEEWFKRDEEEGRRNLEAYNNELRNNGVIV